VSKKPVQVSVPSTGPPLNLRETDPQTRAWVDGLERAARIRLTPELRRRLLGLLNDYLAERRKAPETPNRELKGRLRQLVTHARRLAELLDPPDLTGVDALSRASRGMPGRFTPAPLRQRCEQLAEGAERALEELRPGKPGRPSGELEAELFRGLHELIGRPPVPYWREDVYDDGGEQIPTGGYSDPFFEFCKLLFRSLGLLKRGRKAEVALGQRIRRAL